MWYLHPSAVALIPVATHVGAGLIAASKREVDHVLRVVMTRLTH
jgi:hypothetical protein